MYYVINVTLTDQTCNTFHKIFLTIRFGHTTFDLRQKGKIVWYPEWGGGFSPPPRNRVKRRVVDTIQGELI